MTSQAVLSTCASNNLPHARVVAIREISDKGLLFFTQKGTRKVAELEANPQANLIFGLSLNNVKLSLRALLKLCPTKSMKRIGKRILKKHKYGSQHMPPLHPNQSTQKKN